MIILQLSCPGSEKGRVCSFGSVSTPVLFVQANGDDDRGEKTSRDVG
jgi:hypothetical protein